MRIFVAGCSRAIGYPLIKELLSKGHEVFGMTHAKEKVGKLSQMGMTPIVADVLDENAVAEAIKKAQPEVVIDMLTSLPKEYNAESMKEAAEQDKRVRLQGGRYLQNAAEEAGVRRYIVQSAAYWYTPGPGLATEETALAFDATPGIAAKTKVYAEIENRVLNSKLLEGVVLRFGFFYGPGTWYAPDGSMANRVRQQEVYVVGSGQGVWNFIHVEDAAKAAAATLNCKPGIYNITDSTPAQLALWLPAFARFIGAPLPLSRTPEEEESMNGLDSVYYASLLRGASNKKARRELYFSPRPLEWLP